MTGATVCQCKTPSVSTYSMWLMLAACLLLFCWPQPASAKLCTSFYHSTTFTCPPTPNSTLTECCVNSNTQSCCSKAAKTIGWAILGIFGGLFVFAIITTALCYLLEGCPLHKHLNGKNRRHPQVVTAVGTNQFQQQQMGANGQAQVGLYPQQPQQPAVDYSQAAGATINFSQQQVPAPYPQQQVPAPYPQQQAPVAYPPQQQAPVAYPPQQAMPACAQQQAMAGYPQQQQQVAYPPAYPAVDPTQKHLPMDVNPPPYTATTAQPLL